MPKLLKILGLTSIFIALTLALVVATLQGQIDVLTPAGDIARQQKDLIIFASILSLIVIVPVFGMLFGFALYYRESNKKAAYRPDWAHNTYIESAWLAIPLLIIGILAVITWQTSHSLDPFRALAYNTKPITIQVIALQWKWLFIYPEYNIATVNDLAIPVNTPINFELTADAPMNSFWIPQLGGQIYAMPGMKTKLHLIATETGDFRGRSANISGEGFSAMTFTTRSVSLQKFDTWLETVSASSNWLDTQSYQSLARPSTDIPEKTYTLADNQLFDRVINSYMLPPPNVQNYDREGVY